GVDALRVPGRVAGSQGPTWGGDAPRGLLRCGGAQCPPRGTGAPRDLSRCHAPGAGQGVTSPKGPARGNDAHKGSPYGQRCPQGPPQGCWCPRGPSKQWRPKGDGTTGGLPRGATGRRPLPGNLQLFGRN
ncbi:circumsporozoite protein-like, partial [Homarus americanus]|uniref:circumsporozoite protein-like n=1 Tax=Homarus americanus TaxID=6706 RepID=UPI001C4802D8